MSEPVVDLMKALEDSLAKARAEQQARWRASRCSPERPCSMKNEMHLEIYGECFVRPERDESDA